MNVPVNCKQYWHTCHGERPKRGEVRNESIFRYWPPVKVLDYRSGQTDPYADSQWMCVHFV